MKNILLFFLILSGIAGCELVEYNPNEIRLRDDERNLNRKAMERLRSAGEPGDTLRFILMGDSQRFYDEVEDFVRSVKDLDEPFDFVVHAGDIADFGLVDEFRWVHKEMKELPVPYLAVVGNHDVLANGPRVYREMYGPFDFVFDWGQFHLIFLNSNSREYSFNGEVPDLDWLETRISQVPEGEDALVISHIPPWDGDFDTALEADFAALLAGDQKVRASLHGHQHNYLDSVYYDDGLRYFVTTSMNKRGYALVKLWDDGMEIKKIQF